MIAAAFSSIATTARVTDELEAVDDIRPTEVLGGGPATAFAITGEARGPRDSLNGGTIDVSLRVSGNAMNFERANVTVTMTSETDPTELAIEEVGLDTTDGETIELSVLAWKACTTGPCFEDVRLEVSSSTLDTRIEVTGTVEALLRGYTGAELFLEVTPLGVVP